MQHSAAQVPVALLWQRPLAGITCRSCQRWRQRQWCIGTALLSFRRCVAIAAVGMRIVTQLECDALCARLLICTRPPATAPVLSILPFQLLVRACSARGALQQARAEAACAHGVRAMALRMPSCFAVAAAVDPSAMVMEPMLVATCAMAVMVMTGAASAAVVVVMVVVLVA